MTHELYCFQAGSKQSLIFYFSVLDVDVESLDEELLVPLLLSEEEEDTESSSSLELDVLGVSDVSCRRIEERALPAPPATASS